MPISASDIQKILATEDDFGHEMRVGAAIRAIPSFNVQHGGTYTDSVSGKPRQFDYRCSLTKETKTLLLTISTGGGTGDEAWTPSNQATRLALAIECKNLNPSFPLVICGTSRQEGEAFQDLIVSVGSSVVVQRGVEAAGGAHSRVYRAASNQSFYRQAEFVGKSLLRLKPENRKSTTPVAGLDSDIYEKWAQALSSAVDLVDASVACAQLNQAVISAVLPVVMVSDGSLWRVDYGDSGRASDPIQVDQCEFYLGHEVNDMQYTFMFSHIHFFTISAFGSFLSKMAVDQAGWDRLFDPSLLRFGPG